MARARASIDFAAIRRGLQALELKSRHAPGDPVQVENMLVLPHHRAALDPDRALVLGNRGVGKSFWTHALADDDTRSVAAKTFRELAAVDAIIGFNAAKRTSDIAPTVTAINAAVAEVGEAYAVWQCVLVRAAVARNVPAARRVADGLFSEQVRWVKDNGEQVERILTELDDQQAQTKRKLVVVFDALERLGHDWGSRRSQLKALLQLAMEARSYRALRLKLFLRVDQYADDELFRFRESSKIRNEKVELRWTPDELYHLLFWLLSKQSESRGAMTEILRSVDPSEAFDNTDTQRALVNTIAGEFMGSNAKRGRVFTWLPQHLSDARGETSPRTFLTAWSAAARRDPAPARFALDHHGLHEGVRKASDARREELEEDYWWIPLALEALRGQNVPMSRTVALQLWRRHGTALRILGNAGELPPVMLSTAEGHRAPLEDALLLDLIAVGVMESRPDGVNLNVPDIFRLWAGIGRKGGVPRR